MPSCSDCGKHFSNPAQMRKHYEMEHSDKIPGMQEEDTKDGQESEGGGDERKKLSEHIFHKPDGGSSKTTHYEDGSVEHEDSQDEHEEPEEEQY